MYRSCCLLIIALTTTTVALLPARRVLAADESPHDSARFVGNAVAGETLSAFEWATAKTHPDVKAERLAAGYRPKRYRRRESAGC